MLISVLSCHYRGRNRAPDDKYDITQTTVHLSLWHSVQVKKVFIFMREIKGQSGSWLSFGWKNKPIIFPSSIPVLSLSQGFCRTTASSSYPLMPSAACTIWRGCKYPAHLNSDVNLFWATYMNLFSFNSHFFSFLHLYWMYLCWVYHSGVKWRWSGSNRYLSATIAGFIQDMEFKELHREGVKTSDWNNYWLCLNYLN